MLNIIKLAEKATASSGMPPIDADDFVALIQEAEGSPACFVRYSDKLLFLGVLQVVPWNRKETVATEMFWYADKPSKSFVAVVEEFHKWAKDNGASVVMLGTGGMSPDSIGNLLTRKGYSKAGGTFLKVI